MSTARYLDHPYLLAGRRIDPITGTLSYREVQKHLRRKELEVLALLAEAGDSFVPRSTFIEQIWHGNPIGEQGLTDTISSLRRSLLDTDRENPIVLTIPRRGYQLRASIRWISRDGGVAFVAGSVIDGRPDWRLKQLLKQTEAHESWLAEDGRSRRIFRFCCNELHLRKLRREIVLMRYLREALAGQKHVSTILDWQLEEPPYFLELAAPASGNLRGVMLSKSPPARVERWKLLQQVAEALAAVHAAGIVHRNLTPDSILIDRRDGERVALLGEFGSAALDDRQRLVELGIDPGELSLQTQLLDEATVYTAPECVAGAPATAASDVYALGAVIAQTVCGDFQRLEFSDVEDVPAEVLRLLQRCSAVNPLTRPTAAELAAALRELSEPKPVRWQIERAAEPLDSPAEAPASAPAPADVPAASAADLAQPASAPAESASRAPVPAPVPAANAAKAPVAPQAAAPIAPTEPGFAPPVDPPQIHDRIGRYRILNELAQGGMGVVYLAEQNEPVQRRVALKLIRAGLDSAQVLARFAAERQALALMNHPNISAIFDAGTTPGGYPYFVMEFVPGKDIKTHCDDAKLSIRGRIRLFLQVCDGVLHAHQKGLIHRDLKPSNILVKPKSEQPALVKLIDFGIAKSISGGLGTGLHTRLGSFVGTPVYSSPEQVTDPTREIDTRADLYSLGVVLYEILTGVPPRSAQELDADTPAQLAKRLRDTKTPAMGTRYSGLSPAEQQRIAELRALSTDGLSMQLCSDLDWIVGKCIAQDPDDRYATVQDLRQDLQRWLDGRPVEARPSTVWYRFGKLVRRNKLNTAILATLSVALLGATTAAVTGFIRAEQALHEAEAAIDFQNRQITGMSPSAMAAGLRDTLEKEGARSLENIDMTHISTNLIVDFFSKPALRILDAEYSGQALLQAKLRAKQAEILHRLSRQDLALSTIDSAIDSLDRILDADDQELINTHLLRARILIDLDRFADAREIINQIVQKSRDQGTAGKLTLGQALALNCEYGARGYDLDPKLRVTCDEAVGALRDSLGENDPTVLEVRANRAGLLLQSGLAEEATAEASAVLGLLGKEWSDIKLNVSSSLALGLTKMGREDQALVILQEMKDALVEKYGYRHAGTVAALHNLAATHNQLRQFEAGAKLAEQAMTLQLELYGSANLNSLWAMLTYSRSLEGIGDLAKESEILSRIMQLADKDRIEVKEHLLLPVSMAMARIMIRKGKLEDAEQVLRDASLLVEQVPNIKPSIRLQLKISQAELLLLRDQISEAATLLDEVRGELRNAVDRDKAEIQRLGNLADSFFATVQARQGKQAEAEALYRATLERQLTRIPGPYADYLYTMRELSSLLSLAQRHAEAVSLCRDGLERAKVALHPNHPEMALQLEQCEAARLAAGR